MNTNIPVNKIVILHKKFVRIVPTVDKCKWNDHTSPIFYNLKLLKFNDVVNLKIYVLLSKAKHSMLPKHLQELYILNMLIIARQDNLKKFMYSPAELI